MGYLPFLAGYQWSGIIRRDRASAQAIYPFTRAHAKGAFAVRVRCVFGAPLGERPSARSRLAPGFVPRVRVTPRTRKRPAPGAVRCGSVRVLVRVFWVERRPRTPHAASESRTGV